MIKWFLRESYWAPSDWGVWSHERLTWLMVSASSDVTWQQFRCWVHLPVSGSEMAFSELWASLVAQTVQNLPAVWETQVQTLSQEDPLERGMAAHPSILAWKIPWTKQPVRLQSMGSQELDLTKWLTLQFSALWVTFSEWVSFVIHLTMWNTVLRTTVTCLRIDIQLFTIQIFIFGSEPSRKQELGYSCLWKKSYSQWME